MEDTQVTPSSEVTAAAPSTPEPAPTPKAAAPEGASFREKMDKIRMDLEKKAEPVKPTLASRPDTDPTPAPAKPAEAPTPEKPAEEPLVAAYKPDLKYRFTDEKNQKREEEFPDWAKSAIKDPESEKEIRSIFERAHGLDFIKPRFQQMREQFNSVSQENETYKQGVAKLREQYAQGNLEGIFQTLKISEEKVLQYALERAKYYELPPEQKALIDAQKAAEQRAQLVEQQGLAREQEMASLLQNYKQMTLDLALNRPEVSAVSADFDKRLGKQGAFFEAVRQHGEATWYRSNGQVDLTPEQAIQQVIAMYGLQAPAQAPATPAEASQPGAAQAQPATPAAQKPAVKVIPNVAGGSSSSAANIQVPRSIADLNRIRKEKYGS